MLAVIDIQPIVDAIVAKSWVAAVVAGIAVVGAVLKQLGVFGKPDPAPAPAKSDAEQAKDLLDGKK